jgi:hypothetical protein
MGLINSPLERIHPINDNIEYNKIIYKIRLCGNGHSWVGKSIDRMVGTGSFSYDADDPYIKLSTKYIDKSPLSFLTALIHELEEILHIEGHTRLRYDDSSDHQSYLFHYTHHQFCDRCCRLSGLLTLFIK